MKQAVGKDATQSGVFVMKKVLVLVLLLFPLWTAAEERVVVVENADSVAITRVIVASGEYFHFTPSAVKSKDERYTLSDITPGRNLVIETEDGRNSRKQIVRWQMVELL
ncbi:hypothetical protein [Marinobacter nauticus]|uniref:Uncharacterized protein n=1 Tax=Marinobacter nauticus TaxID=2743 RepID=A0A1M2UT09_MARNT|nr:hypothetical protein [Marinobacter nauticus]OJS98446.1 hypothetical protein BEE62_15535 [Marinobacter nauticus]